MSIQPTPTRSRQHWLAGNTLSQHLLSYLLLGLAAALFLMRSKTGIHLMDFVDETEKFVAAQMLLQGQHLYRDVFAHHGPLLYLFAHLYALLVSATDFSWIRVLVIILAFSTSLSVWFSPLFNSTLGRAISVSVYWVALSALWVVHGMHMLLYYPIGGFFTVMILAQLVLPAFLGKTLTRNGLFASGAAMVLSCCLAYVFVVPLVLLLVAIYFSLSSQNRLADLHLKPLLAGIASATAVVGLWLTLFADWLGLGIYHLYFNQVIYAPFIEFTPFTLFHDLVISYEPIHLIKTLSELLLLFWVAGLTWILCGKAWSPHTGFLQLLAGICLGVAALYLNPRGVQGFQNAAFVIFNLAAMALLLAYAVERASLNAKPFALIFSVLGIGVFLGGLEVTRDQAITSPAGVTLKTLSTTNVMMQPEHSPMYDAIRAITPANGTILAIPFNPQFYIKAERLPASGHYYYLPWQGKYSTASVLGYNIDICSDLQHNQPTVIWFDDWKIWNRFSMAEYAPCVIEMLNKQYVRFAADSSFYIRQDLEAAFRQHYAQP